MGGKSKIRSSNSSSTPKKSEVVYAGKFNYRNEETEKLTERDLVFRIKFLLNSKEAGSNADADAYTEVLLIRLEEYYKRIQDMQEKLKKLNVKKKCRESQTDCQVKNADSQTEIEEENMDILLLNSQKEELKKLQKETLILETKNRKLEALNETLYAYESFTEEDTTLLSLVTTLRKDNISLDHKIKSLERQLKEAEKESYLQHSIIESLNRSYMDVQVGPDEENCNKGLESVSQVLFDIENNEDDQSEGNGEEDDTDSQESQENPPGVEMLGSHIKDLRQELSFLRQNLDIKRVKIKELSDDTKKKEELIRDLNEDIKLLLTKMENKNQSIGIKDQEIMVLRQERDLVVKEADTLKELLSKSITCGIHSQEELPEKHLEHIQESGSIIIKNKIPSRSAETLLEEIKKLDLEGDGLVDYRQTKGANLIVKFNTKEGSDSLYRKIQDSKIKETIELINHTKRIIIFTIPSHITQEDLKKIFKDKFPMIKTINFIKRQEKSGTFNQSIDLDINIANILIQRKNIFIGSKRCSLRRFLTLKRCFKCQLLGHTVLQCTAEHYRCGYCGQQHDSNSCKHKENFRKHWCHNCNSANLKGGEFEVSHSASSNKCPSYQGALRRLRVK